MSAFSGDETAPFFGFLGAAAALIFSCKYLPSPLAAALLYFLFRFLEFGWGKGWSMREKHSPNLRSIRGIEVSASWCTVRSIRDALMLSFCTDLRRFIAPLGSD